MTSNEKIEDLGNLRLCSRRVRVWEPYMRKYDCQYIAEIGICKGNNFEYFVAHNPQEAVAVDLWRNDGVLSRNDWGYTQEALDKQHDDFVRQYADKPFVKVYRDYSFNAVKNFPDEHFDIVYIDADHTYEGCLCDIRDWYPKVKSGCLLIGDDYLRMNIPQTNTVFGVIEAVKEFTTEKNLEYSLLRRNWWVIQKP